VSPTAAKADRKPALSCAAMGRHRKLEAMQQPLRRENFWFMLSLGWLAFLLVVTAFVLGFL